MPKPPNPEKLVKTYLDRIEKDLKAGHATEHTYRAALSSLLEGLLPGIHATNEPKRGKYGAPDYLITRDDVTLGYAEAKNVGVSLSETEKGEQLGRYRAALPNLLLTDYLEFRWYVDGDKREASAVLGTWAGGKLARTADGAAELAALLTGFAEQKPQPIASALELARRMARLTRLIHDVVSDVFAKREASDTLNSLLAAFRETVLPSLTEEEFADMYAQTLAYGLFAARVNHKGAAFNRKDASRSIPKTNPLLQRLFYTLTGPELDEEPYVTLVDDLAALLSQADMAEILAEFGTSARQNDPIVHFYETFLAQYDPRLREQRGVYYTPTPVVDYIVRSVDTLLKRDFGLADGLGDTEKATFTVSGNGKEKDEIEAPRLLIMDPATGTGTFPFQIIRLLRERFAASDNAGQWPTYVREHLIHALYGFELMMAPYAVAHLKLSMELEGLDMPDETAAQKEQQEEQAVALNERLNIYLTNTLDDPKNDVKSLPGQFKAISDEAQAAGRIKAEYPIMVVLGNPPYSGHSANNGQWIDDLLKGITRGPDGKPLNKNFLQKGVTHKASYYEVDGQPLGERNPKWLQDDYVKFIRWAQWRVEQTGAGIVAFITPHGYLDNPTFRGMRQSLMRTFDDLYVLDLHGNANKKEKAPDGSLDQNVFDIRTGVAIGIFVRRQGEVGPRTGQVHRADLWGDRDSKYAWLADQDVLSAGYTPLTPTGPLHLWSDQDLGVSKEYQNGWSLDGIFDGKSPGIATARDEFVVSMDSGDYLKKIRGFASIETEAAREKYDLGKDSRDWQVALAQKDVNKNLKKLNIVSYNYRPFDERVVLYTGNTRGIMCMPRPGFSGHMLKDNVALVFNRTLEDKSNGFHHVFVSDKLTDLHYLSLKEANSFAPLYVYPTQLEGALLTATTWPIDAYGRTPNLGKPFIEALSKAIGMKFAPTGPTEPEEYSPEDVFYYVYAVLHSPSYRSRYVDFLRSDFPRIPLPDTSERFKALADLGSKLTAHHLLKTAAKLGGFPKKGSNEVKNGYPKFTSPTQGEVTGKVMINPEQWFTGISPEVWDFRVGGYKVAEKWLKDRRGRILSLKEQDHYKKIISVISNTIAIMSEVDSRIYGLFGEITNASLSHNLINVVKIKNSDVKEIISANGNLEVSQTLLAIWETYRRIKEILGDNDYSRKWFYISNPSIDGTTPIEAFKSGNYALLIESLDDLEMNLGGGDSFAESS